ncbi:MAG TPA: DUF4123 domain-containing protein [Polyangiaceae bacterium]|nr:DUF4123 domain-containing protein [Polyangiaceae bacterium]
MFVELKVLADPHAGHSAVAASGQTLRVGRLKQQNGLSVPDPLLAPVHFVLSCGDTSCTVRDLNRGVQKHPSCEAQCFLATLRNSPCASGCRVHDRSGASGVYLNGDKVRGEASVRDGDHLVAGTSCFRVAFSETMPAPAAATPPAAAGLALTPEQQGRALTFLAQQKLPLFAVLDAARDPAVLETLLAHGELYYSLYDGVEGEKLAEVAPYLVQLPSRSSLAESLIREHWGKCWGFFIFALLDFKTLRRQLRRFLLVEDERGKSMYFRFYDPRVLRVFLPTCTLAEASEFFGQIAYFLLESEQPGVAFACNLEQGSRLRVESVQF